MQKTAIFGGTFNPPHLGHTAMLKGISKMESIGKILVMPAKAPPHKSGDIVSAEHRVAMCRLAFEDTPKAEICEDELKLPGKSYTVNTLEYLSKKGINKPFLVIGADSLVDFHKWYRYKDILSLAELLVYHRGSTNEEVLFEAKSRLKEQGGKITVLDICPPDISSTKIRELLKNGNRVNGLISEKIESYIKKYQLYK